MVSLGEIAQRVKGRVVGDAAVQITGVGSLAGAQAGQLAYFANRRYKDQLKSTHATAVLLSDDALDECKVAAIVVANPQLAFAKIAQDFDKRPLTEVGIHPTAQVHPSAKLGEAVRVGPFVEIGAACVIGAGTELCSRVSIGAYSSIGNDTSLRANVVVYHDVRIGSRCTIHANTTIGADGFGIVPDAAGQLQEVPQVGGVRIGDDVLIGANCTVDRGAIDDTVIHDNVKIDDQVHVGHNCEIGAHSILCGCSGLGGSVTLGQYNILAGAVGIAGDGPVTLADGVQVGAMSYVSRDIDKPGQYSGATLHTDNPTWRRNMLRLNQLDAIARRLSEVERVLDNAAGALTSNRERE